MGELVLVTGGSGYIGGWCVAELLRRGYQVRTTVRSPDREQDVTEAVSATVSAAGDPAGRPSFAVADLTSDDGWDAAVKGADYVLHVASPLGLSPRGAATSDAMVATARDGTLRVLRHATAAGSEAGGDDVGREHREPVVLRHRGRDRRKRCGPTRTTRR